MSFCLFVCLSVCSFICRLRNLLSHSLHVWQHLAAFQFSYRLRREGGNKRCFCPSVRPSVCPSVAYIANNSQPKFGRKVPHLRSDWHTSFKVKRSKVSITRPINADIHRAPYLPNGKAYELQTWYTDEGRRLASATGAITSQVKGQGHKVT